MKGVYLLLSGVFVYPLKGGVGLVSVNTNFTMNYVIMFVNDLQIN